jgi:hypothetical protein
LISRKALSSSHTIGVGDKIVPGQSLLLYPAFRTR